MLAAARRSCNALSSAVLEISDELTANAPEHLSGQRRMREEEIRTLAHTVARLQAGASRRLGVTESISHAEL
jgi:hypothetical protein